MDLLRKRNLGRGATHSLPNESLLSLSLPNVAGIVTWSPAKKLRPCSGRKENHDK
jgi:hypothetical protein